MLINAHWAVQETPEYKITAKGVGAVTAWELLSTVIGHKQVAKTLLETYGSLQAMARATMQELQQVPGMSKYMAFVLVSCFEIGRRKELPEAEKYRIQGAESAANYLSPLLADKTQEVFYVLFLNRNHEIEGEREIFKGGLSATVVDPKLVFREAIHRLASGIIVAHNHPSGNLKPSQADIQITQKLVKGSQLFDLAFLDHLIISQKGYYSFAEEGLL
ncbi:MAG: DNA repair protein RadC [Bacteroidota bacterium]